MKSYLRILKFFQNLYINLKFKDIHPSINNNVFICLGLIFYKYAFIIKKGFKISLFFLLLL